VVIDQFNIKNVFPFEAEDNSPIGSHCYGPRSLQVTLKHMQAIARKIQGLRPCGGIEDGKDSFHSLHQISPDTAPVATLVEALQTPVLEVLIN
jgi:hypothetical protein